MNGRPIKAILYDNDGVLIDSFGASVRRHQRLARRLGLRIPTTKECRAIWGVHWADEFVPHFWPNHIEYFKQEYLKHYSRFCYPSFPGLIEMQRKIKSTGILQGVVSSRDKETLFKRLPQSGFDLDLFFFIQASEDCQFKKPDPRVFQKVWQILRRDGIKKNEVWYEGDTLIDLKAARDFGFNFLAACTGACTRNEFLAAGVPLQQIFASPTDTLRQIIY